MVPLKYELVNLDPPAAATEPTIPPMYELAFPAIVIVPSKKTSFKSKLRE